MDSNAESREDQPSADDKKSLSDDKVSNVRNIRKPIFRRKPVHFIYCENLKLLHKHTSLLWKNGLTNVYNIDARSLATV